jgi:hypothetical protein
MCVPIYSNCYNVTAKAKTICLPKILGDKMNDIKRNLLLPIVLIMVMDHQPYIFETFGSTDFIIFNLKTKKFDTVQLGFSRN